MIEFLTFVVRVVWSIILLTVLLMLSPLIFIVVAIADAWRYMRGVLQR